MARSGNYVVARILIENGADLTSKAVDGKTPFHNIFNDTIGSVLMRDDWLEHVPPDSEAMFISHFLAWSSRSTPQTFQRGRLCDDADLLSTDSLGRTCLHFAASRGNLGVLSYLVSRVSPDDVDRRDGQGRTPFHYAVESSRVPKVIDLLMDQGCNIFAADKSGRTALHWAARWGNFAAVKKLVDGIGGKCLLLCYANGRAPSRGVCQRRAPALYRYLRGVEASSGLGTEQLSTMGLDGGCATHDIGVAFPLVLEVVGLVILTCMVLLGLPD